MLPARTTSRTKKRNASVTRERLLHAGIVLFAEHGPDATTVEEISTAARVNRRMLYHYYESKEGLYRAVIRHMYEQSTEIEVELSHVLLPADELLERIIRSYYEFLSQRPEFVRLLTWENLHHGLTAREVDIGALKAPVVDALRIALERGRQNGRFRDDIDEKQLLISCMALSFFYFSNRHTVSQALGFDLATPEAIDKRVRHVVRLLLDGIRARNGK